MRKILSLVAAVLLAGSMMAETYTKKALADISATDVVIITMDNGTLYAMSNNKGTSDAPAAVAVTAEDDVITTDADTILWNITLDGDNFTAYVNGDATQWLYATNANNGMRVGKGEANVFSIKDEYIYTSMTEDPRYIGIYNSKDWRCYKTINNNIKDQTLAFYVREGGDVPTPQPQGHYYLVGTMTEWGIDASYKLVANPNNQGEYMLLNVALTANDQFKVAYSADNSTVTTWYPADMGNAYGENGELNADADYNIYFRPEGNQEGWFNGFFYVEQIVPVEKKEVYDVAEIIAAAAASEVAIDDSVAVRGVITSMQLKGKNFAKYGSVNIYIADATGAEGVLEFYNCYSFAADTFMTTVPEYDATSTAWLDVTEVTDRNGLTIHVGDTVIAKGKYTYYSQAQMHELNTGCYLTYAKAEGAAHPTDDVKVMADEQKTMKFMRHGQLFILKNGIRYNLQGQVVR